VSANGYSGTPLWKKLGLRPGGRLWLLDAPAGWDIAGLPGDMAMERSSLSELEAGAEGKVVLAFFNALAPLRATIAPLSERIFPEGALWTAWPRRAGGHESDIRDEDIRSAALALGLVDVKVAAIDEDWSGLRLVWRVERRQASAPGPG
jgi:hypothetical protein